jgi:4-hydroxy-tetrahydrodipicolinate synthase
MFTGSMVALVTPMDPSGSVDWPAFDQLVAFHLEAGTDALVINGTTGESVTLDAKERRQALQRAIDLVSQQIPIIAGTGSNNTAASIDASLEAKQLGADATLLVCPYYNKPTQEGLYCHFEKIAQSVELPHLLYNVPGRTLVDLDQATTVRLAEIDNIVGVKDATGDVARGEALINAVPKDFVVLSGDDLTTVDLMAVGAKGSISVTANLVPSQLKIIMDLALAGNFEQAYALNQVLIPLHQALFCESNPIPVKWALNQMGLIQEGLRLPLVALSPEYHQPLLQVMKDIGLIS